MARVNNYITDIGIREHAQPRTYLALVMARNVIAWSLSSFFLRLHRVNVRQNDPRNTTKGR